MGKENPFEKMSRARKEQQQSMESTLVGEAQEPLEREAILAGRPRKRRNCTTMTISLDQADKEKIKLYAYSKSLTVSDLIHQWIQEKCVQDS